MNWNYTRYIGIIGAFIGICFVVSMFFYLPMRAVEIDAEIGMAFYNACERISNEMDGIFIVVNGACIIDVCDNSTEYNSTIGFPFSIVVRNQCIGKEWVAT